MNNEDMNSAVVALGDLPSRIMGWVGKARARGRDRIELDFATVERLLAAARHKSTPAASEGEPFGYVYTKAGERSVFCPQRANLIYAAFSGWSETAVHAHPAPSEQEKLVGELVKTLEAARQWAEEERRWAETPDLANWITREEQLSTALALTKGRSA